MEGGSLKHIADKETLFIVHNVNPDFCKVNGSVTAFDIHQTLAEERAGYSPDTLSRGARVLHVGSIIKGVQGNAGKGVQSGVSQNHGDSKMIEGSERLFVNGKAACHDGHQADMNVKS